MRIARRIAEVKEWRRHVKPEWSLAMIYTKGFLHEGHISLSTLDRNRIRLIFVVRQAKMECDIVAVIVFVNPLEFPDTASYEAYPRAQQSDIDKLRVLGYVDLLFLPALEEFFINGQISGALITYHGGLAETLEMKRRPEKFSGMCTIMMKFVGILQPSHLYVGRNCVQTVKLLQLLLADLMIPVEVVPIPIYRDPDGLVYDSRNYQMSEEDKALARLIFPTIQVIIQRYMSGDLDGQTILRDARNHLERPGLIIDYFLFVREDNFEPIKQLSPEEGALLVLGVTINGKFPLVDNVVLKPYTPPSFFKRLFRSRKPIEFE